jgi:hypothetical protein
MAAAQCANTAYGAFTCAQTAEAHAFGETSQAVAFGANVTSGDAIVGIVLSNGGDTGTMSVSATVAGCSSTSWTVDTTLNDTSSATQATQFSGVASTTGACTVTGSTTGTAGFMVVRVYEWKGWNGSFDTRTGGHFASGGFVSSGTAISCPSLTTGTSGDLILGQTVDMSTLAATTSAVSPFSLVISSTESNGEIEDVQVSSGAIIPQWKYTSSTNTACGVVALEAGSASCAVPTYSLAAGTYNSLLPRSTTITSAGCTICYNTCTTSSCTPTTPTAPTAGTCSSGTTLSSGGSVTLINPGYETILALGTESGNTNSGTGNSGQYDSVPTLGTLNGVTVGSAPGNISKLNGVYINPYTGYVGKLNGLVTPYTALAVDALQDLHAGTNGNQPATADLVSSVYGQSGNVSASVAEAGLFLLYATAANLGALLRPIDIGGVVYTGGTTTLGLQCTTTTSVSACGFEELSFANASTVTSTGFWLQSSCPSNGSDCGSLGGMYSNSGGDYAAVHVDCSSSGTTTTISIESPTSGCVSTGVTYVPGTKYRINIQMTEYSGSGGGASNLITVCSSTGAVLGTATGTGATSAHQPNQLAMGITGEEPTTAGYTYEWSDYVVSLSGKFSSTACIL